MFIFVLIITIKKVYFFLNDKNKGENKIKR